MIFILVVFALAFLRNGAVVDGIRLIARDGSTPPPLTTADIPLHLDASQHYVVNVSMSSGPTPQRFGFGISMGTGYTVVAGTSCDTCGSVTPYNESASSSADSLSMSQSVQFAGGSASGAIIKEDCTLAEANGSAWSYPNQTIMVANDSSSIFGSTYSGILGLGTNTQVAKFADTIFGGWFSRNPLQPAFSFGMALNSPDSGNSDGGIIHWVVPDSSFHQSVTYKNVTTTSSNATGNSDWIVDFDGWSFQTGQQVVSSSKTGMQVVLDNYFPDLYIPQDQAKLIHASISGAVQQLNSGSGNNTVETWTVPCATKMTFAVTFGSQSFVLSETDLIRNDAGTCFSKIEGWGDSTVTEYLFGGSFISSIYLIFVVTRPDSDTGSSSNSLGFSLRSVKKKSDTGVIVGATLGSLAVALSLAALFFLWRRRTQRKRLARQRDPKRPDYPSVDAKPQSRSFLPLGGHAESISHTAYSPYSANQPLRSPTLPRSPGSPGTASTGVMSPYLDSPNPMHVVMSVERNNENLHRNQSRVDLSNIGRQHEPPEEDFIDSPSTPADMANPHTSIPPHNFTIDPSYDGHSTTDHPDDSSALHQTEDGQDVTVRPYTVPSPPLDTSRMTEKQRRRIPPPVATPDTLSTQANASTASRTLTSPASPATAASPTNTTSATAFVSSSTGPTSPPPLYSPQKSHGLRSRDQ